MKTVKLILAFLAAGSLLGLNSCKEAGEQLPPVELNFDVRDSYTISAMSPEPISFTVSSTAAWEVYSYNPEWCEISPSSGEAGEEGTTVTVVYHDLDGFEARKDTLAIESGDQLKLVTVIQEGLVPYLDVADDTGINVNRLGGDAEISVMSNQVWTAEVTGGSEWISISGGASGDGDGKVVLNITENTSLSREGEVVLKNMAGEIEVTLPVHQDGFTRYLFSAAELGAGLKWEMHPSWQDAIYSPTIDENGALHCPEEATRLVMYSDRFTHSHFGDYKFRVNTEKDNTLIYIFFQFYGKKADGTDEYSEIRWHLDAQDGMTEISINDTSVELQNIPFDKSVAHDVMLKMTEDNGYIHFEWLLDGVTVDELTSSESVMSAATWVPDMPEKVMQIQIGTEYARRGENNGGIFEYYEYAEPVEQDQ